MQGDIAWYSDAASDVAIIVTLTVDTEAQFNDTETQFNDTEAQFNDTETQFNYTEAKFNTTMIEFTDDPGSNTVSLRIQNCTERADVAIFVPR